MSYLARLKALNAKKRLPDELTKLTKAPRPFVSDSEKGLTEADKSPSVSFVRDQGRAVSENMADWEERAAIVKCEAGIPRPWTEPVARLLCSGPPGDYDPVRWQKVTDAILRFLDQWAATAYALGWQLEEIMGMDPMAPAARHDRKGYGAALGAR